MNTSQLNASLKSINFFAGTFPCDSLPKDLSPRRKPCALIVNTDPNGAKGEHWTVLILEADGSGEYFDSFGLPPMVPQVYKYLNLQCPSGFAYSCQTLQHPEAVTCGLYCVSFIKHRAEGGSLLQFLQKFTRNLDTNEQILKSISEPVLTLGRESKLKRNQVQSRWT